MSRPIAQIIAQEIGAAVGQVASAVELLDGGATVPFIARYRKEVTGGLDDTQLRMLAERLVYLRELASRREAIVASITEQGKMTDELGRAIAGVVTKAELEDLYLPYKPKRRTKAMIARELGLQGLYEAILADRSADPVALAGGFRASFSRLFSKRRPVAQFTLSKATAKRPPSCAMSQRPLTFLPSFMRSGSKMLFCCCRSPMS